MSYQDKLHFSGQQMVVGLKTITQGLLQFSQLTEEEQTAFIRDALVQLISELNLGQVDIPGVSGWTEDMIKNVLNAAAPQIAEELAKKMAAAV